MASLGPLPQAEIMAGFPEKVSDWTVIYFYPRHKKCLGYSVKPVNEFQSLSRKPINILIKSLYHQCNSGRRVCQGKNNLEKFGAGDVDSGRNTQKLQNL
jgi:hypothetical protein